MNQEQIIRMAREAGFMFEEEEYLEEFLMDAVWVQDTEITETLERFAALVAAAEREACAQICEQFSDVNSGPNFVEQNFHAKLIRSRDQQ